LINTYFSTCNAPSEFRSFEWVNANVEKFVSVCE
jgi:hypothetical protein